MLRMSQLLSLSLQNCHSFSSGLPNPPFTIATLSDFGMVNDAVSALKKKLEDVFKGEWLRIYQAGEEKHPTLIFPA